MKQLTCEMCGSTDLLKQDGVFVCQSCGCKYSIEEAKKMMVEGTVEVQGTVRVDNSGQIQHYLELSRNAYESANGQAAFEYANKALEVDSQNSQAWIAKMKAIRYLATIGEPRLKETVEAGKRAVDCASEAEKDTITLEVYTHELTHYLELLKVATINLADTKDIKSTFRTFLALGALTAGLRTREVDSKTVELYETLALTAIGEVMLVPDEVIARFSSLTRLVEKCAQQYQSETDALIARYKIYGAELVNSAKEVRAERIEKLNKKAQHAKEEHVKRVDTYWAEHKEEREALEAEMGTLYAEKDVLMQQLKDLTAESNTISAKINETQKNIKDMQAKKEAILFSRSAKRELDDKIAAAKAELSALQDELKRADKSSEVEQVQAKWDELTKRIEEIQAEFDKDR